MRRNSFLGIILKVHNAVYVIDPAVVRSHIGLAFIFKMIDKPAEEKVADYREQNEQNRKSVHLKHKDKREDARNKAKQNAKKRIDRFIKPGVGVFHCERVFVVKIAVLKAFKLHVPRFLKKLFVQFFVYFRTGDGHKAAGDIAVVQSHGCENSHRNTDKNHNCRKGFSFLQRVDYEPHEKRAVEQPAEVIQKPRHCFVHDEPRANLP